MGYCTEFNLTIVSGGDKSLIDALRNSNEIAVDAFMSNGVSRYSVKWYDWERDMRAFSAAHPNALLLLEGQGEDSADLWRAHFKGGRMQLAKARIAFDDFDEARLS